MVHGELVVGKWFISASHACSKGDLAQKSGGEVSLMFNDIVGQNDQQ